MGTQSFIGSLLHLSDPTLPIGGYSHSNGLETYVQRGGVCSKESASEYVEHMLRFNLKFNDALFMRLAWEATDREELSSILLLDQECTALKSPRETREASQKLGVRLMKIFNRARRTPFVESLEAAIGRGEAHGHYCIIFGLFARTLKVPLYEAILAFYHNAAVGMITNAVKLVPLGQLDGQDILFALQPLLTELTEETLTLTEEVRGMCSVAFDIRCMQHEHLYSRLYMS